MGVDKLSSSRTVQVFLLTHNRPRMVMEAIEAIAGQTLRNFELIVSDNSDNYATQALFQNSVYGDASYIYYKYRNCLSPIDHFNLVLSEVSTDYFMVFHDDDLMMPQMIERLYDEITCSDNEGVIAVGGNAVVLQGKKLRKGHYLTDVNSNFGVLRVDHPATLAEMYLDDNICPFDSYLYRSDVADQILLDIEKGGKYSDCSFILDVNCIGPIRIITEALMVMRVHSGQDSQSHSFDGRLKLHNYIKHVAGQSIDINKFKRFRIYNIYGQYYKNLCTGRYKYFSKKTLNISIFMLFNKQYLMCLKLHIKALSTLIS